MATPSMAGETLHAAGSSTVLPVVSEAAGIYHRQHPDVTITVSGGGSGVGIASMIQGTAQIGMASREPEPEEQAKLAGKVDIFTIARDAVAVVVSKAVYVGGVHQLTLKQIAGIYRGKIRNWREVGGPDARILAIDKEASRGTRHAIGMLSNAWLNDAVRGVAVGAGDHALLPTLEHVRDGSYPISRDLHVLLPKNASPAARGFLAFLLSDAGQKIVRKAGYLPVK